jgi:hypothetical protein
MIVESPWDGVWDALEPELSQLAVRIKRERPRISWEKRCFQTEVFPFSAYLSISRDGIRGEEDLILFVGVQRKGAAFTWGSDLSLGDGVVVSGGPNFSLDSPAELLTRVDGATKSTIAYIRQCEPMMLGYL